MWSKLIGCIVLMAAIVVASPTFSSGVNPYIHGSIGEFILLVAKDASIQVLEVSNSTRGAYVEKEMAVDSGEYRLAGTNLGPGSTLLIGSFNEVYLLIDRKYLYYAFSNNGKNEIGGIDYKNDNYISKSGIYTPMPDKKLYPALIYRGEGVLEFLCPESKGVDLSELCSKHQPILVSDEMDKVIK